MAAYPRKQTVFIFIICALITGGTAFYVYGENTGNSSNVSSENSAVAVISTQNATDTIISNIDWKKQFLDTASSSAFKTTGAKSASSAQTKPQTAIDLLGQDFLTKYAQLHQAGLTGDDQTVSSAMNQVVSNSAALLPSPKEYSAKDITISTNMQALNAYMNVINAIEQEYSSRQDEAVVAGNAFETQDMSELSKIDPIIAEYKNIISRLIATPVPQALAQYHIDLINGMSAGLYSAEAFRHMDTDALKGLAAVNTNATSFLKIRDALSGIDSYGSKT